MPSVRDVAEHAGVSVATVSRVLSQADYPVRGVTRQKVLASAELLGYRRNALASNLRHGTTTAVGVCATSLSNLTAMSTVEGISETLEGFGLHAQVALTRWNASRERAALELFLEERAAGVLSFPTQLEGDGYHQLQRSGIPAVLFTRSVHGVPAPVVRHDFAGGYRLAVETLAGAGHRRIAALLASNEDAHGVPELRVEHSIAWSAAVERVGLEPYPEWHLPGGETLDVSRIHQELVALFERRDRPTALFCGLLPATLTALRVLDELGMQVPDDVALVGTTDERWRPLIPDYVPVILLDSYQLGVTAVELLDNMITKGQVTSDKDVVVGVDFDAAGPAPPT